MRHRMVLGGVCMSAGLLLAGAASAQSAYQQPVSPGHIHRTGPPSSTGMTSLARMYEPPGTFMLTNHQQAEIADFSSPRDLSVCVARPSPLLKQQAKNAPVVNPNLNPRVPLEVSWRGKHAKVSPGNCLYFDAARVKIKPAGDMSQGETLKGQIRKLGAYSG